MRKVFAAFATAAAMVLLSGCALLYPNWGTDQNPSSSMSPSTPFETSSPSSSPSPSVEPSKAPGKADVKLFDAGLDSSTKKLFAMADVANFAENGGVCKLTFTGGGVTKTVTVTAEANVQRTQCALMEISSAGLPKGAGLLTIEYSSPNYYGVAPSATVTIP